MSLDRTTSQVLFDNGTHKCISFTSLVKGEGVQANQFLIIDHDRCQGGCIKTLGTLFTPSELSLHE